MTGISWTDEVWNPTTGCDRVSPGCDRCYALTMAGRLKGMGQAKYQRDGDPSTSGPGFGLKVHPDVLALPARWQKPRRIFVNSMLDLFHQDVPDGLSARCGMSWAAISSTPIRYSPRGTPGCARGSSGGPAAPNRDSDKPDGMPPTPRGPEAVRAAYASGRARLFADMLHSMGSRPKAAPTRRTTGWKASGSGRGAIQRVVWRQRREPALGLHSHSCAARYARSSALVSLGCFSARLPDVVRGR